MQNKIPPPLVLLFCIAMTWLASLIGEDVEIHSAIKKWALAYFILGGSIMCMALMKFSRAQTTVNPLQPEKASSLVQDGIFAYTRNPMYLGMALILFSFILLRGDTAGLLWLGFFVIYIQLFQVIPEERAISEKFGDVFEDYRSRVRAWL